jgi:phage terminase large subunit-like protein
VTKPRKKKAAEKELTRGERVIWFIENYLYVPEGDLVGTRMRLSEFQKQFVLDVYDNPHGTRRAVLSMARKNGKTGLIAAILLAHIVGPEKVQNSQIISGAMSRDQAALVYSLASKMLDMNPKFSGLYRCVPSSKKIYGLLRNVEYHALSAEATTAHGLSPVLAILDEVGQVRGPSSPFVEAITTAQGAHSSPLLVVISTQAPSDADMLSLWIDDIRRSDDPHSIAHIYEAAADCDLLDESQYRLANPALGIFRNEKDLVEQLKRASRIPALEASSRNLLLNQRVAQESLWLAPSIWKLNSGKPDLEVFRSSSHVAMGLDLSARNDLTAAILASRDDAGAVHLLPFVFTPSKGLEERSSRDRAPYDAWVRDGFMFTTPGATVDYTRMFELLQLKFEELGIEVSSIHFDRWRINEAKKAAEECGFALWAEWKEVGQGYKDQAPRMDAFESLLLSGKLRHGAHPLMNMAAANAIAVPDPAGNRKLDKSKSTARIDPLVAALMAVFAVSEGEAPVIDVSCMIAG